MSTATNCEYWNPNIGPLTEPTPITDVTPEERRLYRAVILRALMDYTDPRIPNRSNPREHRRLRNQFREIHVDAQRYLFGTDTRALAHDCAMADVPVTRIRDMAHDMTYDQIAAAYRALWPPNGEDGPR